MKKEDRLDLIMDFRFFIDEDSIGQFKPAIFQSIGFYEKIKEKIKRTLSVPTIEETLKIINIEGEINFKDIEKIVGITHRAMWENVKRLEELKLISKEKKKKGDERKEFKLSINPNVKISQFLVYESRDEEKKKDGSKIVDIVSSSNPRILSKMGLKSKLVVDNETVEKIRSNYQLKLQKKLHEKP